MKETVFKILETICEDNIVRTNPDIDLFETDLMDSLGFAELLADIEDELGVIIAPSEVDRHVISTQNKLIAYLEERASL